MLTRQLGEILPISVGTAIALETLVKEEKPLKAEYLFLNIRTIFRNLYSALEDPTKAGILNLVDILYDEMVFIKDVVETKVKGNMIPVFYVCSNKSLNKLFPLAKLKETTTDRQKNYENLERSVMERIVEKPLGKKIKIYDCLIKGNNSTAIMLTHYPLELLSSHTFRTLHLLESNTGIIKDKSEWNTKLIKSETYQNLPFNILTIQLIGDHATQFNSNGIKLINPLLEIAKKNKWTVATTQAKIKFDIEKYWDKLVVKTYLEMLSVKLK